MRSVHSNLRRSLWSRGAALALPATISVVALGGVTARPAVEIAARRAALLESNAVIGRLGGARERQREFAGAGGFERIEQALERLRSMVPEEVPTVSAFSLLRLAARAEGVELEALQWSGERDLDLAGSTDRLVATQVQVTGDGTLAGVVALVGRLRGVGLPTLVESASFERSSVHDERFVFRLTLGLVHFAPLDPLAPLEGGAGGGAAPATEGAR